MLWICISSFCVCWSSTLRVSLLHPSAPEITLLTIVSRFLFVFFSSVFLRRPNANCRQLAGTARETTAEQSTGNVQHARTPGRQRVRSAGSEVRADAAANNRCCEYCPCRWCSRCDTHTPSVALSGFKPKKKTTYWVFSVLFSNFWVLVFSFGFVLCSPTGLGFFF